MHVQSVARATLVLRHDDRTAALRPAEETCTPARPQRPRTAVLPSAEPRASWGGLPPSLRLSVYDHLHPSQRLVMLRVSKRDSREAGTTPFRKALEDMRIHRPRFDAAVRRVLDGDAADDQVLREAAPHIGPRTLSRAADRLMGAESLDAVGVALGAIVAGLGERARPFLDHVVRLIDELPGTQGWSRERTKPSSRRRHRARLVAHVLVECADAPIENLVPLKNIASRPDKVDAFWFLHLTDTLLRHETHASGAVKTGPLRVACEAVTAQLASMPYHGAKASGIDRYQPAVLELMQVLESTRGTVPTADWHALRAVIINGLVRGLRTLGDADLADVFDDCEAPLWTARSTLEPREATAWDAALRALRPPRPV